jgi:DNA-binding MarR family transcriptional regulator
VTPAGHEVFTTVDVERRAHFARVLEHLTDAELEHLLLGLRATRRARAEIAAEEAAAADDATQGSAHTAAPSGADR